MRLLHLLLILTLAPACAASTVPTTDGGGGSVPDVDTVSPPTPDTGPPDDSTTEQDGGDPDPCGACCPGDVVCADDVTVGTCRADGSGFDETQCADEMVCEGGACVTEPVCEPGEVECFDATTAIRCRQSGEGWVQLTCDTGFACSQGECTDKTPLGGGCEADDECATGNCRCGAQTDDGCPDSLGGLCADESCEADSCGGSAYCLDTSVAPTGAADYDHCVRSCGNDAACPSGSRCLGVPVVTADGWEYQSACYFEGARGLGDECDEAAECVTGGCLTDYFDVGFCSRRCDDDGVCPGDGACVELRADEWWCTMKCGDGSLTGSDPCPLDEPVDRFDVTCKTMSTQDGGVLRVCATP